MESFKIAFFCWESMYAERVGGLANAATNLAETLVKQNHEVHYFTRGTIPDQTINGVQYHYCHPYGNNIVEYCNDMSKAMVSQFRTQDSSGSFDFLHFHDWHPVQALHYLQDRNTILTYHSTEYGRNGNQFGDWWEFREISGKEWYGGLIAKRVTAVSTTLRNEVMTLYNVPDEKCDVIPNGVVPHAYRADIDPGEVKASTGSTLSHRSSCSSAGSCTRKGPTCSSRRSGKSASTAAMQKLSLQEGGTCGSSCRSGQKTCRSTLSGISRIPSISAC